MTRMPIRQISRICIPGVLISRAVDTALYPVVLAGPELAKFLEPRVARLCGISDPSRLQRWLRNAGRWLLEEPDSAPEPTEDPKLSVQDDRAANLMQRGFRPETKMPLSGTRRDYDALSASDDLSNASVSSDCFQLFSQDEIASLRARRRDLHVQRSKEALQMIERLMLARLSQDENFSLDAFAEDFADLLFGKQSKG